MARQPDPALWRTKPFKELLDAQGNITPDGHKIMIENQRRINGKIYVALEAIFDAAKALAESDAAGYVEAIPGDEPPGCGDPPW